MLYLYEKLNGEKEEKHRKSNLCACKSQIILNITHQPILFFFHPQSYTKNIVPNELYQTYG